MTITQLEYFVSIIETGSFSQTAFDFHITQSSISKQIAALEDELGVQLFNRVKRKAIITPAGEAFLSFARKEIREYYSMRSNMLTYADRRETQITVGMHCLATHYDTWPPFFDFQTAHPQFLFEVKQLANWDIWDALQAHKCNFGVLYDGTLDNTKYDTLPLATDCMAVGVPENHPLSKREKLSFKDLQNENFVFTRNRTQMRQISLDACQKAGFDPKITYCETFPEPVLSLMRIRNACLLFPKKALNYYALDDIKVIPLEEDLPLQLVVVYPKRTKLTAAEKSFIDFLRDYPELTARLGTS